MRTIVGLLLILLSIALGMYLGLWVMFIGGIVQLIQNITPTVNALGIALGLLRIISASFVGYLSFGILYSIGVAFLD